MLNQYFKPLIKSAQEISRHSNKDLSRKNPHGPIKAPSFEAQLQKGLFVPISQLQRNQIGWSYRKSPVMIYGIGKNIKEVHISRSCPVIQQESQWAWVGSDINQTQQDNLVWCEDCLKSLNYQQYSHLSNEDKKVIKENFSFLKLVQQHAHEYFNSSKLKLWKPGESLIALPEESQQDNQEEDQEEDSTQSCQLCTWSLPSHSRFLITGQQAQEFGCNQSHCILCMQEQLDFPLVIPIKLRWQALQARFDYFNGICENWAQLRFHIDKSWHPLIDIMRQQGIARPSLYQAITCEGYITMVATIVWKERKRAILPDGFDTNIQLPNDWDFWSYSQVLDSFKAS